MLKYVVKRLLQLLLMLLLISFLSFALLKIAGSDVISEQMANNGTILTPEVQAAMRAQLGLDQPFLVQYLTWLGKLLQGDMGYSFVSGQAVSSIFSTKLPATLWLAVSALILTVCIALPLGIIAALKENSLIDYLLRFCSFIGNSMPNFFLALLLLYLFAVKLQWLPVIARELNFSNVVLPALTLAVPMSAKYLRQVRTTVLNELTKDYVYAAQARGVSLSKIVSKSVLKVILLPLLSLFTLSLGSLLGGTAVVETIFLWDGIGKLAVDAIKIRDYPLIQAYVMWMSIIYVLLNLITDLLYPLLDPRIRLGGAQDV